MNMGNFVEQAEQEFAEEMYELQQRAQELEEEIRELQMPNLRDELGTSFDF